MKKHITTYGSPKSNVAGSTRLLLEERNDRIFEGMYVTSPMQGSGIPHLTTVTKVNREKITLSNSCVINQSETLRFDTKSPKFVPFTLVIPAGSTLGSELVVGAAGTAEKSTFSSSVGDWVALDDTGSDVSIGRDGAKLQVTTTTDNEIEGAQLPEEDVGDGSSTSLVAGQVYRVSMDLDLTTPGTGTMSMVMGLGGTLSSAFDITTTETTYTQDITAANATGHLLIYNTSATASVFTVDNVSVKRLSYKNLDVISTSSASYLPNYALGGAVNSFSVNTAGSTIGSPSTDIVLEAPGVQYGLPGMVVRGPGITGIGGANYAEIKSSNIGSKSITVSPVQEIASGVTLTISKSPDPDAAVSTMSGVELVHAQAAITTTSGDPTNNQEIAKIYGYVEVSKITDNVTLPLYIDNLLTSS